MGTDCAWSAGPVIARRAVVAALAVMVDSLGQVRDHGSARRAGIEQPVDQPGDRRTALHPPKQRRRIAHYRLVTL